MTGRVVWFVGAALLLALAGIIGLAFLDKTIPDVLQNIGVGCLTFLGGVIVPTTPPAPQPPQQP